MGKGIGKEVNDGHVNPLTLGAPLSTQQKMLKRRIIVLGFKRREKVLGYRLFGTTARRRTPISALRVLGAG